jgi:aminoglycoside phosphotransferase family enzyme/predicted kinase
MKAPGPGDALLTYPPPIAGLLRPAAYPHAVTGPIRVAETHISWVLLTGAFAYKIKKPLRLSFLDYSTLERRRELCEEEVRLNRRHAADLYLGVSAIGGTVEEPRVEGTGPALEYAVRMRQFEPGEELVALLAAGTVDAGDLAALGEAVARLHVAAAAATDPRHGHPDTVRRITGDNYAELRRLPECGPATSAVDALEHRLAGALDRLRGLMLERQAAGRVRECHGDLHCGNVVRWHGRLIPFDGIEFDESLRFIDVVNDIAFLTMDLAERGRSDLRRAALQAWCETLGDFAGLPLLPCYECYRSLVRAKVAALAALQSTADPARRAAAVADCLRYLDWAGARLARRRPVLLLTCGLSGSGKTWLARQVAPALGALHLRSDVERKRLAGFAPHEDSHSPPDGGIYTPEFNERTYARLEHCADAALAAGESVVVDAACLRRTERLRFLELAQARGAPAVILACHAPDALLHRRLAERRAARSDASEAGPELLARQAGYWEPFGDREQARVVAVDTGRPDASTEALARIEVRLAA